uniref:Chordin-like protein n=1 Tax=Lottia goshimai TaxID=1824450 RepID=A0A8K1SZM7_9GAST|nr:chordin-like protein [Lottia goshimai]
MMVYWLVALFTTFCLTTSFHSVTGSKTCFLDNRKYEIGDSWHPVLEPFGRMPCINCTCNQDGEVKCVSEKCPRPKCQVPEHRPGKCCPICIDHVTDVDPTDEPLPGCIFNGAKYADSDVFPSNKTGLKPTRNDQCVMCVCSMGHVLCHLKTCLPVKCMKLITTEDDCCPRCTGMAQLDDAMEYDDDPEAVLSDGAMKNKTRDGCRAMGYKDNGTSWHPVVGIFGEMKCITCRCSTNGKTECRRETCPPDSSLPCKKPRQDPGVCCKSCPDRRRNKKNKKGKKGRRKKKKNRVNNKKRKKKPDRDKRRKPDEVPEMGQSGPPCLPKKTDRFVYYSEEKTRIILALKIMKEKRVEVTTWTVNKGRLPESVNEVLGFIDFDSKYRLLQIKGATNERRYKKTEKKLKRKLSRCKTRCRKKVVINIVNRMKLKPVKYSAKCQYNL